MFAAEFLQYSKIKIISVKAPARILIISITFPCVFLLSLLLFDHILFGEKAHQIFVRLDVILHPFDLKFVFVFDDLAGDLV
jgi:hypothetical protein